MESDLSVPNLNIGVKLRQARLLKRMRMRDVADLVGCSESLISRLENDKAKPSFTMLHKLVVALETNIAYLFASESDGECPVRRAGARPVISIGGPSRGEGIHLEPLISYEDGHMLQADIHIVDPGCGSEDEIVHDGEEVGYVLEGTLEITIDGRLYTLTVGDSFGFPSNLKHGYRNPGKTPTRVLWVNTPPTY